MSCAFCLTSEALEQVLPTCWETLTLNWYFSPFFVIINALAVCTFFNFTYLLNLAYLSLRLIPSQISISAHCIPPLQGKRGIQHVSSVPFILISNSAFRHALGDIKIAYFVLPFGESFVMRIINYQEITHKGPSINYGTLQKERGDPQNVTQCDRGNRRICTLWCHI